MGLSRYEALREIERKRQGYAANDWAAWLDDLEAWVVDLLEGHVDEQDVEKKCDEAREEAYDNGFAAGKADVLADVECNDLAELRRKLDRLAALEEAGTEGLPTPSRPRCKVRA